MIQGKFSGDGFGGRASRLSRDLLQIWTGSSQQITEKSHRVILTFRKYLNAGICIGAIPVHPIFRRAHILIYPIVLVLPFISLKSNNVQ